MGPLSLLVLLLASPAAAPAGPVTISACSGGIRSYELTEGASYEVTLRNTSRISADEVRLSVRYGRHERRATFDLKETFAPNVDLTRRVRRNVNGGFFTYVSDQNDCTVDYVHFADGTSWTAPATR